MRCGGFLAGKNDRRDPREIAGEIGRAAYLHGLDLGHRIALTDTRCDDIECAFDRRLGQLGTIAHVDQFSRRLDCANPRDQQAGVGKTRCGQASGETLMGFCRVIVRVQFNADSRLAPAFSLDEAGNPVKGMAIGLLDIGFWIAHHVLWRHPRR
ncbi:hypothetical protein D3C81_1699740 [compost metagenome]